MGSVRRLLLDPARGVIIAAQLERPAGGDTMIDWPAVAAIGPDAVMVADDSVLRPARDEMEQRLAAGELDLAGKLILTEHGDSVGQLEDLELDEVSGRVSHLIVPGHSLPPRFVSLGRDALVIAATNAAATAASARE